MRGAKPVGAMHLWTYETSKKPLRIPVANRDDEPIGRQPLGSWSHVDRSSPGIGMFALTDGDVNSFTEPSTDASIRLDRTVCWRQYLDFHWFLGQKPEAVLAISRKFHEPYHWCNKRYGFASIRDCERCRERIS